MGKKVVIAEKPSVAGSIAKVLGCGSRQDGYFENSEYIVTWAIGHLVALKEPDELDEKYKKWSMDDLPILPESIPLKVSASTKAQYRTVEKLINSAGTDMLICATDAGREGELIFRYIYQMAKCKKPFKRLWISSLTDEAIRDGFRHLEPGEKYDPLYRSARSRSEADWLVGMNGTRAYTLRYGTKLNVGRVKTPTLAFLTKRKQEIDSFVPEEYYTLKADFGDYKGIMFSDKLKPDTHIAKKEHAEAVAQAIKGARAVIESAETQRRKSNPPQLYDLTSLQRDANRYFGFTAQETLSLAQSLYEKHKAFTYPRTDSRYLPPDMVPVVRKTMQMLPDMYKAFEKGVLPDEQILKNKRLIDASKVTDHHAILPTPKEVDMDSMSVNEQKLYDLVTRRMLAAFYPVCEYDSTTIVTRASRFTFRTKGQVIIIPGWRSIDPVKGRKYETEKPKDDDDDEESTPLPPVKKGDTRIVAGSEIEQKYTKPPAHYTDASLLAAMETAGKDSDDPEIVEQMKGHGIGTPATRAGIIEQIIKEKYADRNGKQIIATEKGIALIQIVPAEISSAETTGRWEQALNKIAEQKQDPAKFRESICRFASFLVDHAKTNQTAFNEKAFEGDRKTPRAKSLEDVLCPICKKNQVLETEKGFSCSDWKNCGFNIWKDTFDRSAKVKLTNEMMVPLLANGSIPLDPDLNSFMCLNNDYGYSSIYICKCGPDRKPGSVIAITSTENRLSYCPHCHKTQVREYPWGYKCAANCGFTLFKDVFQKGGGPNIISRAMFEDLITEGTTEGLYLGTPEKKGVIAIDTENIYWYRTVQDREACNPEITKSIVLETGYRKAPAKKARKKTRQRKTSR